MKARDVVNATKNWWDSIPGWHERIIWAAGGAVSIELVRSVIHAL